MRKEPIFQENRKWFYELAGRKSRGFPNQLECAKAYIIALLEKEPKYKPLFMGKTWREIFKIAGISIREASHEY